MIGYILGKQGCPAQADPLLPQTESRSEVPESQALNLYGLLLIALSSLGFASMVGSVRLSALYFDYPTHAAAIMNTMTVFALSSAYLLTVSVSPLSLRSPYGELLALRGALGSLAFMLIVYSLAYIPSGEATSIFAICPIFTMLLAQLMLKESTSAWDVVCAIIGLFGIALIGQPKAGGPMWIWGSLLVLCGAGFGASAYVCVRYMGTRVHFMLSVFSASVCGVIVTTTIGGREAMQQVLHNMRGTMTVMLGSIGSFLAQGCLNKGLQMTSAGQGLIMKNLEVPLAYMFSILVLGESPTLPRVLGSCLVVSAVVFIGLRQALKH